MAVASPYDGALARIPVQARSIRVSGSVTRYWEYGDPAATTTIVMVHGFRGDHHGLEPIVAQLPDTRVISPDLPGFGESEPLPCTPHDIDGYSGWLHQFIAAVRPAGRLVVLGHSFGSIIVAAALSAAEESSAPDAVVLINPIAAPALAGPRGVMTRLVVFYYWLASVLPEKLGFALLRNRAIVRVMSAAMAKTTDPPLRAWIHDQHDRYFSAFSDRRVVLEAFRASVSTDVSRFAPDIAERTLLIAAEKDDITRVAAQERLVRLFPDAELCVLGGIGHLIHYEAPHPAADEIRRFLKLAAAS